MNDKIKELAVRSGVVESHVDWEAAGGNLLEKFAELIIKECTKVCNHTGLDVSNGNHIPAGFYDEAEEDMGELLGYVQKELINILE